MAVGEKFVFVSILKHLLVVLLTVTLCSGTLFDFRPIVDSTAPYLDQREACKNLGYDGLAVINSPEAYSYALKLTEAAREENHLFVGLSYKDDTDEVVWDDNTTMTPDTPHSFDSTVIYGRMLNDGTFRIGGGTNARYALCGNHKNIPMVAHGITVKDARPSNVISTLMSSKVRSYTACVFLCSGYINCRAAEFLVDSGLCNIIPQDGYTGCDVTSPGSTLTFFRERYAGISTC